MPIWLASRSTEATAPPEPRMTATLGSEGVGAVVPGVPAPGGPAVAGAAARAAGMPMAAAVTNVRAALCRVVILRP